MNLKTLFFLYYAKIESTDGWNYIRVIRVNTKRNIFEGEQKTCIGFNLRYRKNCPTSATKHITLISGILVDEFSNKNN